MVFAPILFKDEKNDMANEVQNSKVGTLVWYHLIVNANDIIVRFLISLFIFGIVFFFGIFLF